MLLWIPVVIASLLANPLKEEQQLKKEFQSFLARFRKVYDEHEYQKRYETFVMTKKRIDHLNSFRKHNRSAIYGITEFADLTPNEFHNKVLQSSPILHKHKRHYKKSGVYRHKSEDTDLLAKLPKEFPKRKDWRDINAISSVKNQGECGACWAFSTVGAMEAMVAIKRNKPVVELSVQQVVDCAKGVNRGCEGGDTCGALEWMFDDHVAVEKAEDYPLQKTAGPCKASNRLSGVRIYSNFTCDNYIGEETKILKLLAYHGPVAAAVDARSWQDYLGGIIQYNCEANKNHAVLIVGYDISGEIPYYIVKNTWGPSFGIDGYLHVAVGNNLCAIAEEISAVDVVL